ncbi:S-adenosyl-L-methionine-dependent methyltransferase [Glomus cerebriforme]|uniref:S-adenosyl-L-methionine-dependent methyltransferase n=1 Tax=Glomus cerebriforme TaxID=658196 RepID=A0A397TI81_9GLOM|nr:S-adenosyl-L-methionine-dependent methyltransferase [Glomus cerebriforme]
MGKSLSKNLSSSNSSYSERTFTSSKQTSLSTISTNSRSNSFLNKRVSSFSIKSSSKWSLATSLPKNTPPSNSIFSITAPNTPGTPRNPFIDSSDYFNININNNDLSSEYKFIDGRRFHNIDSVKYFLPNDELEMDRLKTLHYILHNVFQSNFSSPVNEILKIGGAEILDLGCGPGAWLLDMAETFPKSNFTGVDLTNTLIGNDDMSKNIKFIKGNVLDGLPFKNSTFDYVFIRNLSYGFSEQDWKDVINELIRITKPGGWIELMEPEFKARDYGQITIYLNDAFIKDLQSQNICINITTKLEQFLIDTKQIDRVFHDEKSINCGSWAGRLGELVCEDFIMIMSAIKPRLSQIIGVNHDDYDQLLKSIPDEMNECKSSFINHRFWAQKLFPI